VTVIRTSPVVQRGISAELADTEFDAVDVDECDLAGWAADGGMVVVGVRSNDDLGLLIDLREGSPEAIVVALVDDAGGDLVRGALRAGANSSVPIESDPRAIVLALRAAEGDMSLMPAGLRGLLVDSAPTANGGPLTDDEVGWLRELAGGSTVAQLAHRAGYSQREMFRLLGACYKKLGTETRIAALMRAAKRGLI
jgi:DNA-binding NarL/FixJ family response regulator